MKYINTKWHTTPSEMTKEMTELTRFKVVSFTQIITNPRDSANSTEWCGIIGYDDFVEEPVVRMFSEGIALSQL